MNLVPTLKEWVFLRMRDDAGRPAVLGDPPRIHFDEAPQEEGGQSGKTAPKDRYPFVRFSIVSAVPRHGNGARRFSTPAVVRIEALDRNASSARIEPIAQWIDGLFGYRASGTLGDLIVGGSRTENEFCGRESSEGSIYQRLGADYRFEIYAAPAAQPGG